MQLEEVEAWLKQPPAGQPAPSSASCAELSDSFAAESVTQSIAILNIVCSLSSWRHGWSLEQPSTKNDGQRKADHGAWTTTSGGKWADWNQVDARATWRSSRDLGAAPAAMNPGTLSAGPPMYSWVFFFFC